MSSQSDQNSDGQILLAWLTSESGLCIRGRGRGRVWQQLPQYKWAHGSTLSQRGTLSRAARVLCDRAVNIDATIHEETDKVSSYDWIIIAELQEHLLAV